ncbi:hypothetical protein [Curtobacterium sp. MCBD17_040]|uniref:hypothetical protein n=1 Tax=Curtobacterium sp. MCBD17_040 TaxID=2175674 RepID=UPI000DA8347F|nr:hypothetical protein [Curtobacterium sp. MCBD17_040]WIB65315.1 hypothetical protein DEI94_18080 [Curtobacterium sp. MCBD17_040]
MTSSTILRKQQTGEPTNNGGHFGTHTRPAAEVTLPAAGDGPSPRHVALAAEHGAYFPDSPGANPKHWWRVDRVKAALTDEEPDGLSYTEAFGWRSVNQNIIPMVHEWLQKEQLPWIADELDRQEQASRDQANGHAPAAQRPSWRARADRLRQLADRVRAISDEMFDDARASALAPTMEESIAEQRRAATQQVLADRARREAAAAAGRAAAKKAPVFDEVNRRRRGQKFFTAEMKRWPKIGTHQNTPLDEIPIVGHYFAGPFDFWAAEYDPHTGEAWGFTRIDGHGDGEWGHQQMPALEQRLIGPLHQPIERETVWSKRPFGTVERY